MRELFPYVWVSNRQCMGETITDKICSRSREKLHFILIQINQQTDSWLHIMRCFHKLAKNFHYLHTLIQTDKQKF